MSFTKKDIRNRIAEILPEKILFESAVFYTQDDFISPASEESTYLLIALKSACDALIKCWIKGYEKILAFEKEFWGEDGDAEGLEIYEWDCSPVSLAKFNREFQTIKKNLNKDLPLLSMPFKAFQLSDKWNEQIFLLENETSFMLVYWATTA